MKTRIIGSILVILICVGLYLATETSESPVPTLAPSTDNSLKNLSL